MARLLRKKVLTNHAPGRPDFLYKRAKVAVFVHGCFWHRCPTCRVPLPRTNAEYWRRKLARNVERDRLDRKELEELGWTVLVIWEHEVRDSPGLCAARVRRLARFRPRQVRTRRTPKQ